jgi:hypothetical protein
MPPPSVFATHDQLRDHTGKKREHWTLARLKFKESNARSAPFCYLQTTFPRSKNFEPRNWWSCSAPASGSRERKWVDGGMISDSRSLLSAGGCLVAATGHWGHMCRQDELTDAIGLSGAAVVEN